MIVLGFLLKFLWYVIIYVLLKPKLNIAMPSPPSEIIDIDRSTISGIFTPHLQKKKKKKKQIALSVIKNFVNNLP
jgi:hypothetical protein